MRSIDNTQNLFKDLQAHHPVAWIYEICLNNAVQCFTFNVFVLKTDQNGSCAYLSDFLQLFLVILYSSLRLKVLPPLNVVLAPMTFTVRCLL